MDCVIKVDKAQGKVFLAPSGKESILFNKLLNILDVSNFDKALNIYNVTQTQDFKNYNLALIKQYRADRSVVKTPIPTQGGFSEVFNKEGNVRIVYKETPSSVQIELIESFERGKGLSRKFLQDFIYSFPNKDIELVVSPRDKTTSFQNLATFYQSVGFEFKKGSSFEMVRYFNKGRLYPEGYDINAEPSVQHLMNYINQQGTPSTSKQDVIKFMQSSNITSSDDLLRQLSRAEQEGIFIFNKKNLENTELFSKFEISKILKSRAQQTALVDMLKYLRQNTEEITIDPISTENTEQFLPEGKVEVLNKSTDTDVKIITNNILISKKKRPSNVKTIATLEDTFNPQLAEDIAFIRRVSENDWLTLQQQIKILLTSVEESARGNGINLKGLSNSYNDLSRNQILNILNSVEDLLEGNLAVEEFDSILNQYLGDNVETQDVILKDDEVLIDEDVDEEGAFISLGLLKIGKNIYKRVKPQALIDLLNTNSIKTGRSIEEIEQEVNKYYDRDFLDVETAKRVYLLKSNLGVFDVVDNPFTDKVETVLSEVPENFVQEFAEWLIDNDNYLFKVDNNGISFTDITRANEAMQSLPQYLKNDLTNYSKISESITVPSLIEEVVVNRGLLNYDRAKVLANPRLLPEYQGLKTETDFGLAVTDYNENFLKNEGKIYELNEEIGNVSLYSELPRVGLDINLRKPEGTTAVIDYTRLESSSTLPVIQNILTEQELNTINEEHYKC